MLKDKQGYSALLRFPRFDSTSIRHWLHLVEAKFQANAITEDAQCFTHVFGALTSKTNEQLFTFKGDKTFKDLKTHLLQEYGPGNAKTIRTCLI